MNIENLQEWIDMPLGSNQAIDDRLWWIIRVPGGWVLLATNGSCFVPEIMSLKKEAEMIKAYSIGDGWKGRRTDDPIITTPCNNPSPSRKGHYELMQKVRSQGYETGQDRNEARRLEGFENTDFGIEIKPIPPVSDWYNLNKNQTPL